MQHDPSDSPERASVSLADCRVEGIGFNFEVVFCRSDDPRHCRNAMSFGNDFVCLHPQRQEILARSKGR
jgi:hypothetical protein